MTKKRSSLSKNWKDVIAYAEHKLDRARLKVLQLETLIAKFRTQAKAGEPSPLDLTKKP